MSENYTVPTQLRARLKGIDELFHKVFKIVGEIKDDENMIAGVPDVLIDTIKFLAQENNNKVKIIQELYKKIDMLEECVERKKITIQEYVDKYDK